MSHRVECAVFFTVYIVCLVSASATGACIGNGRWDLAALAAIPLVTIMTLAAAVLWATKPGKDKS